jgi:ADP-L-glycero-D-manno-heptose 6-epimerase
LNPYGVSKNEFDKWAIAQTTTPPFWTGLKFFNVTVLTKHIKDVWRV